MKPTFQFSDYIGRASLFAALRSRYQEVENARHNDGYKQQSLIVQKSTQDDRNGRKSGTVNVCGVCGQCAPRQGLADFRCARNLILYAYSSVAFRNENQGCDLLSWHLLSNDSIAHLQLRRHDVGCQPSRTFTYHMNDGVGMHLRHAFSSSGRRLTRRYPWLRYVSITSTTTLLTLIWLYVIWKGERGVFQDHISDCHWDKWEEWPHDAAPHHLVFVADPQLVDPHTYPGRPWPLSSLTESYTDMYMSRNFRLVNEKLDPDSIVFLGDLFDGGREWATERARNLKTSQRQILINLAILDQAKKEGERIGSDGKTDLNVYKPGENGRWSKWKMRQWTWWGRVPRAVQASI